MGNQMGKLEIVQIPCLSDNYGYLVHDPDSGETATIDTPETGPIPAALEQRGWQLTAIFNTHHHFDHAGCNLEIKEKTGCKIYGPSGEADNIPGLDEAVDEGDMVRLGNHYARIMNVGGHTLGHIAYYFAEQQSAFVGDTLFALGCGRIFEGTPAQMWRSLRKIASLPPATTLYCAHEYTEANARFAITVDPQNPDLQNRMKEIAGLRADNRPTVPMTLAQELATNPFLRAGDSNIRAVLDMPDAPDVDVFAEIRRRKDVA